MTYASNALTYTWSWNLGVIPMKSPRKILWIENCHSCLSKTYIPPCNFAQTIAKSVSQWVHMSILMTTFMQHYCIGILCYIIVYTSIWKSTRIHPFIPWHSTIQDDKMCAVIGHKWACFLQWKWFQIIVGRKTLQNWSCNDVLKGSHPIEYQHTSLQTHTYCSDSLRSSLRPLPWSSEGA